MCACVFRTDMAKTTDISAQKFPNNFEEAVTKTGFGKFNIYVLLTTGLCLMCVIIETMCAMFIIPAAQCDLNLSLTDKGILLSINFLGVVSGSHMWGYMADTKGRKRVVLISLISSAIVSFVGSFVNSTWLFILLRFINGVLIGGSSAIIYAFAGEFHDNRFRPKVVSWIATFVAIGNMYLPGLAWAILPLDWSFNIPILNTLFRPWRLLMIIYALPSIITSILVFGLPESPKYLLAQGKQEEALNILRKMYCINTGQNGAEYPVSSLSLDESMGNIKHEKNESMLQSMWKQTIPVFNRNNIVKTVMVCYLQFAIFLSTTAVNMWYPQILNSMSNYGKIVPQEEVTMCKSLLYEDDDDPFPNFLDSIDQKSIISKTCKDTVNEDVFLVALIIGACYSLCYILIGSFINMVGARRLLIGFITITSISGLCAQILSGYSYVQITLGIFLMAGTGIGIVNAIVVDLYTTQIRGMALAVSLMFGRFGAMTGSNIAGPLIYNFCDYLFYLIAVHHIMIIIVVLLLRSQKTSPQRIIKDIS